MQACLDKVRAALDVIAEHDPDRLRELRERFDVVLIWYGPAPAAGSYLHSRRLCELNCEYVEKAETEPARVAMTLVHELAHARLMSTADPRRPMSLPQAEWLCIGAEVAFAKKLPGAEHLVSAAQRRLDRRPEFYSPEAHAQRTLEALRALSPPGWLMRLAERMYERRFGRPSGSARPDSRA
ncbi:MAG: hypothetical protein AB1941_07490 [Gemmatimonadota bacterium]